MTRDLCSQLVQVARRWLDPQYPLRQQAIREAAAEFQLSPASFALGLDWIFSLWTEATISAFIAQNPYKHCRYVAQVLAGNTPAMIAQGFLQGAILNVPQIIKVPSLQPTFARLLLQSFAEHGLAAERFELNPGQEALPLFYAKLRQADLVFAYGTDETLATLKQHIADTHRLADTLFIGHGHEESAAVLCREATNREHLEALAYDMLSYDQRGCLSPRVTLVERGGALSPEACARLLAEEILPALAEKLPRGGLLAGEAAEILHQRSVARFRGPVYVGSDWTLCYDEDLSWPTQALPRFMYFKPFDSMASLVAFFAPLQVRLMSVGFAGPAAKMQEIEKTLTRKLRISPLGEMQKQLLIF